MIYQNIVFGRFIRRVNRFVAQVEVDKREQTVHVRNTGRLKELFIPGADVILQRSDNPERKTPYSLIGVYHGGRLINIDSQVPNQAVFEALNAGLIGEIGKVDRAKREVTYGKSRFDIYFEQDGKKGFIEVKGVTLQKAGTAMFPDAPTTRGTKHIHEMIEAVQNGYAGYVFFLVQMKGIESFRPHEETDPDFANALRLASQNGVHVLVYDSLVLPDEIRLGEPVNALLL